MEKSDFQNHDREFAVMFDAACFLLRSFDLYSMLCAGSEGKNGILYKQVMREIITLTAKARVRCAFGTEVPDALIPEMDR